VSDKCYVCLRVTASEVLRLAHQIWEPKRAREIGLEACEIIKKCYGEKPIFFCGKSKRSILGGLFYILGVQHDAYRTQHKIAQTLSCSAPTVQKSYRIWLTSFPRLFAYSPESFEKTLRQILKSRDYESPHFYWCTKCGKYHGRTSLIGYDHKRYEGKKR